MMRLVPNDKSSFFSAHYAFFFKWGFKNVLAVTFVISFCIFCIGKCCYSLLRLKHLRNLLLYNSIAKFSSCDPKRRLHVRFPNEKKVYPKDLTNKKGS